MTFIDYERHQEFVPSDLHFIGIQALQNQFQKCTGFQCMIDKQSIGESDDYSILGSRLYLLCQYFINDPIYQVKFDDSGSFELYDKVI